MAGTLAPDADFNVASEAPIAPVNYQGLAGLLNTAIKSVDAASSDTSALDKDLSRALLQIRAKHDQGKHNEAYAMESNVLVNYTRGGGSLAEPRIKTLVQATTGRDPEDFGNSPEEVAIQETLKSDEYGAAFIGTFSTHPGEDVSPEQRQAIALGQLSVKEGRQAILEQAQFNWSAEGEAAMFGMIQDFDNVLFGGVLLSARNGDSLSLEQAQRANAQFRDFRRQIEAGRPANVSNEEWGKITKRLDQTQQQIDYFETVMAPGNVGAQAMSNVQQAIRNAGLTSMEENLMLNLMSADASVMMEQGVVSIDRQTEILRALSIPEGGGISSGQLRDSDNNDPYPTNDPNMTATDVYDKMIWSSRGAAQAGNLTTNDESREVWGKAITLSLSNMGDLAARGEWMTDEQYGEVFGEQFFEQLNSIKDIDPALHGALTSRSLRALTTSGFALQERLDSVSSGSPLEFDIQTQQFRMSEAGLRSVVSGGLATQLINAAVTAYGDDSDVDAALSLALLDNGNKLTGSSRDEWIRVQGEADRGRETMEQLTTSMFQVISTQRKLTTGSASDLDPQNSVQDGPSINRAMPGAVANDVQFMESVVGTSGRLNMNPNDLLRAIDFETAGTFDPSLQHAGSSAVGLIGFLRKTAKGLGFTTQELQQMTRAEQMEVVEQYLTPILKNVPDPTFGDVYLAIHYPAAIGKGDGYTLYSKGSAAYKANSGLDQNNDGHVSAGEAVARAWGGSSSDSKVPSSIGAAIQQAAEGGATSVADAGINTSAPFVSPSPVTRPTEAPGEPVTVSGLNDQGSDDKRTASEAATQAMRELVFAQFPDLTPEEADAFIEKLQSVKAGG